MDIKYRVLETSNLTNKCLTDLLIIHEYDDDSKVISQREKTLSEYTLAGSACSKTGLHRRVSVSKISHFWTDAIDFCQF